MGVGGRGGCGVLVRREGGAGVLPQKRCDWTGWRQNWLTVAGPMLRAERLCLDGVAPCGEGGGAGGTGTVATDRSPCVPRYGVGWGCAVRLRVSGPNIYVTNYTSFTNIYHSIIAFARSERFIN